LLQSLIQDIALKLLGLALGVSQIETKHSEHSQNLVKIPSMTSLITPTDRLQHIDHARHYVLEEHKRLPSPWVQDWIERSWQRCLSWGHNPKQAASFEAIGPAQLRQVHEKNQQLIHAASAELDRLSRAIAGTRYFALLTDAQGVVIDTRGDIDRQNKHANAIARVGVDLSERNIGTSAIGAALMEQRAVWLHRGEHFLTDANVFSCAGAPLFGPDGQCVGMLDLTGVDVPERPELQHLAAQSARSIENALLRQHAPDLLLHVNWTGLLQGNDHDGLIGIDRDGWIIGANMQARQILHLNPTAREHASDIFALSWESLHDAAQREHAHEAALWSGLRVQVKAANPLAGPSALTAAPQVLKDVESDLIRSVMQQARGNVSEAAKRLGISRATLYRKISPPKR
jgi:sigma-54 dependent transcriptional regulator, acetoin dehydrogenase operon transcriptional activator AcoR